MMDENDKLQADILPLDPTDGCEEVHPPGPRLDITWLSDVEEEEITWLWEPYIPLGELTLLAGDGKVGKSTMAASIAASVTTGAPFEYFSGDQPGEPREPRNIVFLSAEDSPSKVMRRRFRKLGADVSRVALPKLKNQEGTEVVLTLKHLTFIRQLLEKTRPTLLVVDPIQSYLGEGVDAHRVNEVRPVLDGLALLAQKYDCAILLLAHLNKSDKASAVHRIQGSTDFVNRARSVLLAGKTPSGERALIHERCNLAAEGQALGYRVGGEEIFTWTGPSELTAKDLLGGDLRSSNPSSKLEAAKAWLQDYLGEGPQRSSKIDAEGKRAGHSERTLRRASKDLGVVKWKDHEGWHWGLPGGQPGQIPTAVGQVGQVEATCSNSGSNGGVATKSNLTNSWPGGSLFGQVDPKDGTP